MTLELNRTRCCGLRELHGIQFGTFDPAGKEYQWSHPTPEEIVWYVKGRMFAEANARDCAFITFSASNEYGHDYRIGDKLSAFIAKNRLGTVHKMKPARNPNSGNMLKAYLWRVNREAMKKFKPKEKKHV